ncbi:MAG TPA: site-specific DNA-methyltransferase [Candidatus Cloacimonadota bacterium]|nr:site-specific DNA-methyltransferase [Candidatus Cloacimonadota bacterium]
MTISDITHKGQKRPLIPSNEEAGFEKGNKIVSEKIIKEYPRNPVVSRGQDPELFWLGKYGKDDTEENFSVDIRSLYRHEHISPKTLIKSLYRYQEDVAQDIFELFGNNIQLYEEEKVPAYYKHSASWSNRLILGDSLLVMSSLLEREGLAGQVQMVYIDPPYGIKYGSNWQIKLNNRVVVDGKDEHLSGEAEQIKAYRDTWELGIHSYLGYLRDRLVAARELLTESGSCFVQISDDNVHLVRCLMDEVFGSENFISLITVSKTSSLGEMYLDCIADYIIFYAKNRESLKYRPLYHEKRIGGMGGTAYTNIESPEGIRRKATKEEFDSYNQLINKGFRFFRLSDIRSQSGGINNAFDVEFMGKTYKPRHLFWKTHKQGIQRLIERKRIEASANSLNYVRYIDDFPVFQINNVWDDLSSGVGEKFYVVQTNAKIIQRCLLMTTDPGDLVIDPTCGSGTTAYVAEQWGRRWITMDTSRIALNVAKTRLMTAQYSYYLLHDEDGEDIRHGFKYKKVPHITLKSMANDEEPEEETLFDQPYEDNKRFRVSGPFTVETLQSLDVLPVDQFGKDTFTDEEFLARVKEQLKTSGIINGLKEQRAKFIRLDDLSGPNLHLAGYYNTDKGESKAYIHLGPKFSTVSKAAVSEAIKECRQRGDADWLIILFFSIEDTVENGQYTTSMGGFELSKVRMQDDLMQDGLLKKDKKAASFVTIGEPDIKLVKTGEYAQVKIEGLDIYDPISDSVSIRNANDIAYWMVDDDYDGTNFMVRQVFFCGGDKDEFDKWKKKLDKMASESSRKKASGTLKIEIDDEAWDRLYGLESHPIPITPDKPRKIAVRVVSQFGEECTKVLDL